MAAEEGLDDRVWSLPPEYASWIEGINASWRFPQPGVNAENVHLVFAASPFCDPGSANKRFENEVNSNPEKQPLFFSRRDYEKELRDFPGDAYYIVDGPEKSTPGMNLVWVVEKRFNMVDRSKTKEADMYSHEVRGHYVVVADQIIAAPTLMDVLQSRWTASMLQLSNFYRTASTLPLYSIEKGYTYLHPSQKKKPSKSTGTSARTSRAASPAGSQSSLSRAKDIGTQDDDDLIGMSFQLTLRHSDEYVDENPLVGEPGSFKLSTTGRSVKDKEAKERERLVAVEAAKSEKARSEVGETSSQKPSGTTSPVVAAAPLKTVGLERKATGLAKGKSPTSALGEGVKKRRKSKAPVTPGVISPS